MAAGESGGPRARQVGEAVQRDGSRHEGDVTGVGGIWCSGEPLHGRRHWCVGAGRVLHVVDAGHAPVSPEERHALKLPIPGTAQVVAFGTTARVALLDNGEAWYLDYRRGGTPMWRHASREADSV